MAAEAAPRLSHPNVKEVEIVSVKKSSKAASGTRTGAGTTPSSAKAALKVLPGQGCCRVETLLSVDARGQMVLPKDLRDRAGIKAGDKLALATWERDGKVCCITLVKAEELAGLMKGILGPMIDQITGK